AALRQFVDSALEKYPLADAGEVEFDPERLRFSLHGLRGTASNLGLPAIAGLAGGMEAQLRAGRAEGLPAQCRALRAQFDQVRQALSAEADVAGNDAAGNQAEPTRAAEIDLLPIMERLRDIARRSELDDSLLEEVCLGL